MRRIQEVETQVETFDWKLCVWNKFLANKISHLNQKHQKHGSDHKPQRWLMTNWLKMRWWSENAVKWTNKLNLEVSFASKLSPPKSSCGNPVAGNEEQLAILYYKTELHCYPNIEIFNKKVSVFFRQWQF
jgi:hypothetical protein